MAVPLGELLADVEPEDEPAGALDPLPAALELPDDDCAEVPLEP